MVGWGRARNSQKTGISSIQKTVFSVVIASFIFALGVQYGRTGFQAGSQNQSLGKLDYSAVDQVYNELRQNFDGQLDQTKLEDGLKEGLARATGDPYTEYLSPQAAEEFNSDLNGSFTGIGAELSKDAENKSIVIVSPIAGFPAEKAGLRPKDIISEIDGKSAYDLSVTEAVKRIRGPKETKVKLTIVRGNERPFEVEITRQEITIPSVESKVLDGNVGYIKIARFSEDTAELTKTAAKELRQKNVVGVVLDVRGNPGGLLDAAVDVSSLWLKDKTVLTERRSGEVVKTFTSRGTAVLEGVPTVVLIDDGSASASEIVAGALHDTKAARLMGVKSFGKGSVQQLQKLSNGGVLKVTIARWFTPDGKNIDKAGIEPDQKVERSDEDYKNNRDPQLDAAAASLKK